MGPVPICQKFARRRVKWPFAKKSSATLNGNESRPKPAMTWKTTTTRKTRTKCPKFFPSTLRPPSARPDDPSRIGTWPSTPPSPRPCSSRERPLRELPEVALPPLPSPKPPEVLPVLQLPPMTTTTRKIFTAKPEVHVAMEFELEWYSIQHSVPNRQG